MKKSIVFLMSIMITMNIITGCSKNVADNSSNIVIASGQAPSTMNPINAYDGWYLIRYGVCETLTKINEDYSIEGLLVEDYFPNEDNTIWTFTVKEGITFSNGNILDAQAIKSSLENVFENGERGVEYFTPTSIITDGKKLIISTEKPEPILPNKLADPLFSIIDVTADNSNIDENGPIGTGPFILESFDYITKACTVAKNKNYWAFDVKSDKIEFEYTEEQSVLTMGLESGDFDVVYNVSMNDISSFENNESYKIESNTGGRTTIGFMNQNGVLKDKVLRNAIIQMQDRQSYSENLLKNQYVAGKTLITPTANYGYNTIVDLNEYNPENAKRILDEAGYKDYNGDGFLETPNNEEINLRYVYYTGRPEQQILVEATQAVMAEIGIKITPEIQDTQKVMEMQKSGDYDLLCMNINIMNCGDPENQINTYFKSDGTYNATGYKNEKFDSIMEEVSKESDYNTRKNLVIQAEQILLDDAVAIFYCYPITNFVMNNNIYGIKSSSSDFYWINANTEKN